MRPYTLSNGTTIDLDAVVAISAVTYLDNMDECGHSFYELGLEIVFQLNSTTIRVYLGKDELKANKVRENLINAWSHI